MTNPQSDLTRGLSADDASRLTALGVPVQLPSGRVLFDLGSPADQLFLLVQGRIALSLPMQVRGRTEGVVVEEKRPGETLGWSALVHPHRFTLKAAATVDSDLLGFPRAKLMEHFASHPAVGYVVALNVASVIGHRLQMVQTMWLREIQRVVEMKHA